MNQYIKEAIDAVQELNETLIDPDNYQTELVTNGYYCSISIGGFQIYHSEDDDLSYEDMNGGEREYSILEWCKIKIEELKQNIINLKFI